MQSLKHVGRIKSTGKKVLVAYRTLPGDAYSALVVSTENLPDEMHNAIINCVESPASQEAYEFADALDRTQFPDGSRMLPALHSQGRLLKVGTSDVEMTPAIGVSVLLSELNQIIAEQRGVAVDALSVKPSANDKVEVVEVASAHEIPASKIADEVYAPDTTELEPNAEATPESRAKYFRSQADKLAKQAAEMRRKAEELVPTKKSK